jgi:hypothetical protein
MDRLGIARLFRSSFTIVAEIFSLLLLKFSGMSCSRISCARVLGSYLPIIPTQTDSPNAPNVSPFTYSTAHELNRAA